MERFPKIVSGSIPLTIFAKRSILDFWQSSECVSDVVANSPIRILKLVNYVKYSAGCLMSAGYNLFTILSISLFKLYLVLFRFFIFPFHRHILRGIVWGRKVTERSTKVRNSYTRRTKLESRSLMFVSRSPFLQVKWEHKQGVGVKNTFQISHGALVLSKFIYCLSHSVK